ncbi:MAG TPA: NUDIX hydrolase [Thermoleophilaceae bacterium]|nr:NUDIX hydrolase [Thermoleophilaceae bacterium]
MKKIRGELSPTAKDTTLEDATFRLPDGREKAVPIVHRPDAVVVVPVRLGGDGGRLQVLLVRQPRPAVDEDALIELVAGKIEPGDDALTTARRELAEEAGLEGLQWRLLSESLVPASGYSDERVHVYTVMGLSTVASREDDAHITREWVALDHALRMVRDGEIREMKARDALRTVGERFDPLVAAFGGVTRADDLATAAGEALAAYRRECAAGEMSAPAGGEYASAPE